MVTLLNLCLLLFVDKYGRKSFYGKEGSVIKETEGVKVDVEKTEKNEKNTKSVQRNTEAGRRGPIQNCGRLLL